MHMAKVPLIHNPAAGGGRSLLRFKEAVSLLALKGIDIEPVATERPGHATELAHKLAGRHDTLIVLGGDGTLSEAANGILTLPANARPRLGFMPAGTGNDFLRDFGVVDLESAAQAIALGRTTAVDAVDVTWPGGQRFAINICGTGLTATPADLCNRQFKWMGKRGYDIASLIELMRMRTPPTRLTLDGKEQRGDYPLVVVCNSVHTGGAMKMAPQAKPTDGLLDVLTAEGAGRLELAYLLLTKLRKGTHVESPKIRIQRARHVRVEPREPSPLMLDGEVLGTTPVEMRVLPGALKLLA